jgi:hypothetical protein
MSAMPQACASAKMVKTLASWVVVAKSPVALLVNRFRLPQRPHLHQPLQNHNQPTPPQKDLNNFLDKTGRRKRKEIFALTFVCFYGLATRY